MIFPVVEITFYNIYLTSPVGTMLRLDISIITFRQSAKLAGKLRLSKGIEVMIYKYK